MIEQFTQTEQLGLFLMVCGFAWGWYLIITDLSKIRALLEEAKT